MATATVLTLREFEELADDGKRHELNQGELVSVTHPKFRHSWVAQNIHDALSAYVKEKKTGRVFFEVAYLLAQDPPTLRIPDVSYLSQERIQQASSDGYVPGGPELAVEVVSPSDSADDLQEKIEQYLASGSQVVWVVYPKTRTVNVFRQAAASAPLGEDDLLEEPHLFPGWSIPVTELF